MTSGLPSAPAMHQQQQPHVSMQVPAQLPPIQSAPPALPLKRPADEIYTAKDMVRMSLQPTNIIVRSGAALAASKRTDDESAPYLGRVVWDPAVDAAKLLDSDVLSQSPGGLLDVFVDVRWLAGVEWEFGDPAEAIAQLSSAANGDAASVPLKAEVAESTATTMMDLDEPAVGKDGETKAANVAPAFGNWTIRDVDAFRKRKVWGTLVYTDDSDPVAAAVHSGWLRLGAMATMKQEHKDVKAIKIVLRALPRLIHYQGSLRGALKSRSWGNGHDGASFTIESVSAVQVCYNTRDPSFLC